MTINNKNPSHYLDFKIQMHIIRINTSLRSTLRYPMKLLKGLALVSSVTLLAACGSDSDDATIPAPAYSFTSVVDNTGTSAVSYSGQATRHQLINELKALIGSDELQQVASKQDALDMLNQVYLVGTNGTDTIYSLAEQDLYTEAQAASAVTLSLNSEGTNLKQSDYADLSGGKNLQGKMAGQDNDLTQSFIGWSITLTGDQTDNDKPDLLIQAWFDAIADLAIDGNGSTKFVDANGVDYQQLVQKFLLGAVTYSQAAEDYLSSAKLLSNDNLVAKDGTKPYTALGHGWDEGFGYFGAGRDYINRTDADNKNTPDFDQNQDGLIDLYAEYNFGHSVNAAKRDAGATVAVDYTKNAFDAFKAGRQIIQDNYGTEQVSGQGYHAELVEQAGIALNNWENAIAATVIHYINDVITETQTIGTQTEMTLADRAKHWAEMKGFALSLQFSPVSQINTADLTTVLSAMGEAPVASINDVDAFVTALEAARDIMQVAYGFDAQNVANW
jgi:hypothetical protein